MPHILSFQTITRRGAALSIQHSAFRTCDADPRWETLALRGLGAEGWGV